MIWESDAAVSGIFLCGQQAPCLPLASMASVSFKRSNRAVWAGQIEDRHVRLVGMTFQPFRMAVQHSEADYGGQVTEEGLSY